MSRSLGFRPSHTQLVAAFLSIASVGVVAVSACSKESKASNAPGAAGAAGAKGDAGVSVVVTIIEPGEDCTFGGLSLKAGSDEFVTCNSHPADMDILSGVTLVVSAVVGGDAKSISLPVSVELVSESVDEFSVAVEKIGTPGSVCDTVTYANQSIVCVDNAGFGASAQAGDGYFVTLRSVKLAVRKGGAEAFPVMGRVFVLDNNAPSVPSTIPADDAKVQSAGEIKVTFNEPVDAETINQSVLVKDDGDVEQCEYWSLNAAGTVVTCKGLDGDNKPADLALAAGSYTIAVSGVKDLAGNDMDEFTSTTFTVTE